MMNKSYEADGADRLTLTAPVGGVVSGGFYRFGRLFGCAVSTVPAGKPFTLDRKGVWNVKVEAQGAAITVGAPIYWEAGRADAEFHRDNTDTGGVLVGYAVEPLASGAIGFIDVLIEPVNEPAIA